LAATLALLYTGGLILKYNTRSYFKQRGEDIPPKEGKEKAEYIPRNKPPLILYTD
jgi:hypothetical protein